jgi:hypothetical protein
MPYLLLLIALLTLLYGLYRFIMVANVKQVTALFLAAFILGIGGGLFFLAVTGRLGAALALLLTLWPIIGGLWLRYKRTKAAGASAAPSSSGPMTRAEALDILGLTEGVTADDIRAAHKRLIAKMHPDQDGSTGLAARINAARDVLLK